MMDRIPKLILASHSPRRASLLKQMGFSFDVISVPISEGSVAILDPEERAITLSHQKASAVLDRVDGGIVIGADTIVCLDGEILGKPENNEKAKAMLLKLSGKMHKVYTGFTLIHIGGKCYSDVERTSVTFRILEEWEIDDYVKTGAPLDKAGGYGIQDRSGLFVDCIDGCFYNVVGFPLTKFWEGLHELLDVKILRHLLD